jgi:multicomponent Na+:H+ antiporter subunit F
LAESIVQVAAALIFGAISLGVIRLVLGPTTIDRIVAIDMLTII